MIFDAALPKKCMLCRCSLNRKTADCLCDRCREKLDYERRLLPARELPNVRVVSAAAYKDEMRSLLIRTKEGSDPAALPGMQSLVCRLYDERLSGLEPDLLTFIPSSHIRSRSRGFTIPQELAKSLSKHTGVPVEPLFKHTLISARQAGMSAGQRKSHAEKSIYLRDGIDIEGKTILIIDDILASGSTMDWCARLLRESGASEAVGLVLAKSGKSR